MKYIILLLITSITFAGAQDEKIKNGLVNQAPPKKESSTPKTIIITTPKKQLKVLNRKEEKSLMRVNVTSQKHSFIRPWEKESPSSSSGLAALVSDENILVTASLIENANYIELEHPKTGDTCIATVKYVDYNSNLAILTPSGENKQEFLENFKAVNIANDATIGDSLEVFQFDGNGTLNVTEGFITAIDISSYGSDSGSFIVYELKATLLYRTGSYTLPIFKDGKLVGLLLSYSSDEQISEIIPAPIINKFIKDASDGTYDGFPFLGISFAMTLDEQLREYSKIDTENGGIYITKIFPNSSAEQSGLKVGDVILDIGGFKIDSRGNYDDPLYGKVAISNLIKAKYFVGDQIPIEIIRDGKKSTINAKLINKKANDYVIPLFLKDRGANFLIAGGFIFQELTKTYLQEYGSNWYSRAPFNLVHAYTNQEDLEREGIEKLVILSAVIPTNYSYGYERLRNLIVNKVDNKRITKLMDLKNAINDSEQNFIKVEFDTEPGFIYIDKNNISDINMLISKRFGISKFERIELYTK